MNIVEKLLTALRGGIDEAGEHSADGQALAVLEQEMREANTELQRAKDGLVEVMAGQRLAEAREKALADKIAEYEGYALQALEKGEEALAAEVAAKIVALEAEKREQTHIAAQYRQSVRALQHSIHEMEANLRRIRQQADTVKATANVQKAQEAVAERFGSPQSKMHNAMESLVRIRERQIEKAMEMEVRGDLARGEGDLALQEKLLAAGIGKREQDAQAVLERLKAQKEQ